MIGVIQSVKLTGRKGIVGMGKLYQSDLEMSLGNNVIVTQMTQAVNWARKYSFFIYPFITACCGMEFMSVAGARYDLDRFG